MGLAVSLDDMADNSYDEMIAAIRNDPMATALLVDFDGTLTPIVLEPLAAQLDAPEIELIHRLSMLVGTLAVVSGRPGTFLVDRLDLAAGRSTRLRAYGRGGLDVIDPSGKILEDSSLDRWLPTMEAIARRAQELAPDAWVETKGVVITLHWRMALDREPELRAFAAQAMIESNVQCREGKMSVELFPSGTPSKASVASDLGRDAHVIAFIGDDFGDLEAFDVLDQCAQHAQTFRGCVIGDGVPEEMVRRADFLLDSPHATIAMLNVLERELRD